MNSVTSKLSNYRILKKDRWITTHLPETKVLTLPNLKQMLNAYPTIYLKPDNSCWGMGIIRVSRVSKGRFLLSHQDYNINRHYCSYAALCGAIKRLQMKRPYIVQQGIDSFTKTNQLFDMRVHLMRLNKRWKVVGMVGRIAPKNDIITNTTRSKYVPVKHALFQYLGYSRQEATDILGYIRQLATLTVINMSNVYPKWNEFGLDLGLDQLGRLWIYEINIYPGTLMFQRLNPKVYRRIHQLRKISS
jgi:hypothetical protein